MKGVKTPSRDRRPKVGPYATAMWSTVTREWKFRLTPEGQYFLANWIGEHGSGVGLLQHLWYGTYRQALESGMDIDDIEAECAFATAHAVRFWHPELSGFSTFVAWHLRSFVQKAIRQVNHAYRKGVKVTSAVVDLDRKVESIVDILGENPVRYHQPTAEEQTELGEMTAITREAIAKAIPSEREREIIALRFGLFGQPVLNLDKIGKRMRLSKERVRQLEARALQQIKKFLEKTAPELVA